MRFAVFNAIFTLVFLGVWLYCFVLFIKLARRGIKALDIYIKKNEDIR